jgi:endoplasmic reticulum lectin 1
MGGHYQYPGNIDNDCCGCRPRYLRQYHEERDGKEVKIQEYFLGKFSKDKFQELLAAETKDKVSTGYRTVQYRGE